MNEAARRKPGGSAVIWSWFLLIATCILAVVPIVGFVSWIIGIATIAIVTILAIVTIGEGRTSSGVFILLAAWIVVPIFLFAAPLASSALFLHHVEQEKLPDVRIKEEVQIDERLRAIEEPAENEPVQ